MINYAEIKEKYPKAFEALLYRWNQPDGDGDASVAQLVLDGDNFGWNCSPWEEFDDRDLFDFFDERGLDISILSHFDSSEGFVKGQRTYTFQVLNFDLYKVAWSYNTRSEAETAAFTKAFEILESQLSQ